MTDGEARAKVDELLGGAFRRTGGGVWFPGIDGDGFDVFKRGLTAHLLAIDAAHGVEVERLTRERDDARGAATGERNVLRRDLAAVLGERATLRARIATLEAEVAEARGLLGTCQRMHKCIEIVGLAAFLSPAPETPNLEMKR